MDTAVLMEIENLRRASLAGLREKFREVFQEETRSRHANHGELRHLPDSGFGLDEQAIEKEVAVRIRFGDPESQTQWVLEA